MQILNKIPLLNFEAFAENEPLLQAEKLFEDGRLTSLTEPKKGLWEGVISADQLFYAKIGVYRDHVMQAECTCQEITEKYLCAHALCTLFGIRQRQMQDQLPKIQSRSGKKTVQVRQILDHAGQGDLKHFMLAYSKKDKKFRILLMTYFARQFHDQSEGSIYRQILEDCFPVSDVLQSKNARQNVQLLVLVANELMLQAKDALSLEKLTEAFHILRELITKLAYAIYTNPRSGEDLEELLNQAHDYFVLLLEAPVAPVFRQQIADTMLEFTQVSFYLYTGPNNFFNLLLKMPMDEHRMDTFLRAVNQKIFSIRQLETQAMLYTILIRIQFAAQDDQLDQTIEKLRDPALLNEVITQLNRPKNKEILEIVLQKLKNSKLISSTIQYKHLLALYASLNEPEKQLYYATELFRLTRELQYYRVIKNIHFEGKRISYKDFIKSKLNPVLDRDFRLGLELCVMESDFDLLLKLLIQKDSLEWFMEYDKYLVRDKKKEIYSFYRDYLVKYHKDHIGIKAANRANAVLSHMEKLGMDPESKKLKIELISNYPRRNSLKEYL